jgi:hypothetical protein
MDANTGRWMNELIKWLFAAEERRLDGIVSDLNRKNCEAQNKRLYGFRHQGMRFVPKDVQQGSGMPHHLVLTTLVADLVPKAESLIRDTHQINEDKVLIRQMFVRLLDPCVSLQEIRDAIPDCTADLLADLAKLSRTNSDPLWSIRHDERAVRQYTKLISKIEMYAVTRMLY